MPVTCTEQSVHWRLQSISIIRGSSCMCLSHLVARCSAAALRRLLTTIMRNADDFGLLLLLKYYACSLGGKLFFLPDCKLKGSLEEVHKGVHAPWGPVVTGLAAEAGNLAWLRYLQT